MARKGRVQAMDEPDDANARAAAQRLRSRGFTVRWDGEFWLIRDDRGEPSMSGRGTREDLLAIDAENPC